MINIMSLLQWVILSYFLQQNQDCFNKIIALENSQGGSESQGFCELARDLTVPETVKNNDYMAIPFSFTSNLSSCHYLFSEILLSEPFTPYCYSASLCLF